MAVRDRTRAVGRLRRTRPLAARVAALAVLSLATSAPALAQNLGGGFIEFLLGGGRSAPEAAAPAQSPSPAPSRGATPRPSSTPSPASVGGSGLTYCVRTCDGYAFPLGTLHGRRDVDAHRSACAAACPGAPTELYLGSRAGGVRSARSVATGAPYTALPTAFLNRRERVAECSCAVTRTPAEHWASGDPTLRRGDVVVTASGALVYDGGAFVDFREANHASGALRRRIDATLGLSAREQRIDAWRRSAAAAADRARARAAVPPPAAEAAADVDSTAAVWDDAPLQQHLPERDT